MTTNNMQHFNSECRKWREFRKISQLELALSANVSQRHLSYLETGRSQPSRDMVMRLSAALDVPLRERNVLLQSAGFSAIYNESSLDDPVMASVLDALNNVLTHHDPYPALVVDRFWCVKMKNTAADLMLDLFSSQSEMAELTKKSGEINLALLTLHPNALRKYIINWSQAGPQFLKRLQSEASASGDPAVRERFAEYIQMALPLEKTEWHDDNLLPVLPLELNIKGLKLSLFSVISTFGTPQDVTTDELRIETFYPNDSDTEAFFKNALK